VPSFNSKELIIVLLLSSLVRYKSYIRLFGGKQMQSTLWLSSTDKYSMCWDSQNCDLHHIRDPRTVANFKLLSHCAQNFSRQIIFDLGAHLKVLFWGPFMLAECQLFINFSTDMKIHFAFDIFSILLFLLLDFTYWILHLSVFVWEVCNRNWCWRGSGTDFIYFLLWHCFTNGHFSWDMNQPL